VRTSVPEKKWVNEKQGPFRGKEGGGRVSSGVMPRGEAGN